MSTVPAKTIRQLMESPQFLEQISRALPRHLTADKFVRVAITATTKTPKLLECDQSSLFNALLTLSELGLAPDGRRAHLIPFQNNKKGIMECQLIIDYKGLVELAMNTGEVANIHADVVCESDTFIYDKGTIVQHSIDFKQPRGAMYAAYALIRFKDGTEKAEVMTKDEVDAVRKRSKTANAGPWVTDYNEMAKKTAFRRASKWVKLSPEQRDAIERDDDQFAEAMQVHRAPIAEPKAIPEAPPVADSEPEAQAEQQAPTGAAMATGPQIRTIQTILTKLGIVADYARHEKVSNALARERVISSMTELTQKQASDAIAALGKGPDECQTNQKE